MTPINLCGRVQMLKSLGKAVDAIGSVGTVATEGIGLVSEGMNVLKEKAEASVEEERIEQAKCRILAKAQAIKEIAQALQIGPLEAEQLLNNELNK